MARVWETAGFLTIAAALHVSAAAVMLPLPGPREAPVAAPPATLAAGSPEVAEMVATWQAPPEMAHVTPPVQPPIQPAVQIEPLPAPGTAAVAQPAPPRPLMPDTAPAHPNLLAPPPPVQPVTLPDPPTLQRFDPPSIRTTPDLSLALSARPDRRPARPPEPEPQVRRVQDATAPAPAAGQGGRSAAQPARAAGTADGAGQGAGQRASLMAHWGSQIRSCVSRRAAAPRGVRQGGRVTLALTVARNGTVRGIGVAGSSGQAALDNAALNAARRAGRCPAAPAALPGASHSFTLPIDLQLR